VSLVWTGWLVCWEVVEEVRTPAEARAALESLGIEYTEAVFLRAARSGHFLAVVKLFVWAGMSVETADDSGWTALHWAARRGYLDVVAFLVGSGADLEATNDAGLTAADIAARWGHRKVAAYLLDPLAAEEEKARARAALDSLGIEYTAAAFLDAAEASNLKVVQLFVEAGMPLETVGDFDRTALHYAVFLRSGKFNAQLAVVKYLVEQGANVDARDSEGFNPAFSATFGGYGSVAQYLVEQGASRYAPGWELTFY